MSEQIKPCPFCGGEPTTWWDMALGDGVSEWEGYNIKCCYSHVDAIEKVHAIEKWNTRAQLKEAQTLAAAKKVVEREGMVCVPREPTEVMFKAGGKAIEKYRPNCFAWEMAQAQAVYKAMLSAAAQSGGG